MGNGNFDGSVYGMNYARQMSAADELRSLATRIEAGRDLIDSSCDQAKQTWSGDTRAHWGLRWNELVTDVADFCGQIRAFAAEVDKNTSEAQATDTRMASLTPVKTGRY